MCVCVVFGCIGVGVCKGADVRVQASVCAGVSVRELGISW